MTKCFEGWKSEYNPQGRCCCNCRYNVQVMCHPWNTEIAKGSITQLAGWGCQAPDFGKKVIFTEKQHSVCEIHEWKIDDI